jgi:3-oxoadipate enol-lactonase
MHYRVDDFTDPWQKNEVILLLHGNAESSNAWFAWVPTLSRHFKVIRPDMRGFGASTPMPKDHKWSLDELVSDFIALMDQLETSQFGRLISRQSFVYDLGWNTSGQQR